MLNQSTMTFANAKSRVAEAAGNQDQTAMLTKAGYAVQTALEHWNNFHNWKYLQKTHTGIAVVAPFTAVGDTASTTTVTSSAAFGSVVVNDIITGTGIEPNTTVTAKASSSSITISRAATATNSGVTFTFYRSDYDLPSDFKYLYNARLVSNPRILYPVDEREYDRIRFDQTGASTPTHYSLFSLGESGKIRLLPRPSAADTLILKYHRRTTIPSADGDVLDVQQDHEFYVIALAKAFYLADKGGDPERQGFWWNFGTRALAQARAEDARRPDQDEGFIPGVSSAYPYNPNQVTPYLEY